MMPVVENQAEWEMGVREIPRFVDCVNFFTSKNVNFVQCGLQSMSLLFFENSQKNGPLSNSIMDGATKKLSDWGIVQEAMHNDVC